METQNQEVIDVEPEVVNNELKLNKPQALAVSANDSPMVAMANMMASGINIDADKMEKLFALQKDYEANEARKAFHVAMAAFKSNPPKIAKDMTVSYKQTRYNHASLANVAGMINSALGEHGLSASWVTAQKEGMVIVTCKITHVLGHSEETALLAAPDATGSKNSIQAIGSTVSYLQRYTILALTGLATGEHDNDGVGAATPEPPADIKPPNENETEVIQMVCDALPPVVGSIVSHQKVASLCYSAQKEYPRNPTSVPAIAEWMSGAFQDSQLYDEIK